MDVPRKPVPVLLKERVWTDAKSRYKNLYRCVCGGEFQAQPSDVRRGFVSSCGCWNVSKIKERRTKHGFSGVNAGSEYRTWKNIRQRCTNPNVKHYLNYGGRGIKMCPRWLGSFENFYADMGPKPSPKLSIDRINNDGDYEPGNCRWATAKEQVANQRPRRKKAV